MEDASQDDERAQAADRDVGRDAIAQLDEAIGDGLVVSVDVIQEKLLFQALVGLDSGRDGVMICRDNDASYNR